MKKSNLTNDAKVLINVIIILVVIEAMACLGVISKYQRINREQAVIYKQTAENSQELSASVEIAQDITKLINLKDAVLVQEDIYTTLKESNQPREEENISVVVPAMDEKYPEEVKVISNGVKLESDKVQYNQENKTLEIINDTENKQKNEYNLVYIYNGIQVEEGQNKSFKLQTKQNALLKDSETQIEKEENTDVETGIKGTIVNVEKVVDKELYKGYMYVNTLEGTVFNEMDTMKISKADEVGEIELISTKAEFEDEALNKYDVLGNIIFKSTTINKEQLKRIFGEDFKLQIVDDQKEIQTITKDTESDETGNITINYEEGARGIKIITNKPQNEGNIQIQNIKAIKGNLEYNKEQLKTFNKLILESTITEGANTSTSEAQINLNDTITQAKITVNKEELSTLNKNENVQIDVVLKSDSERYDLYKNPYLEIKLPEELQEIRVNSINALYNENMEVTQAEYNKEENAIKIQLKGEQQTFRTKIEEGIQVVINADLTFKKDIPSKEVPINMTYTNENGSEQQYEVTTYLKLNSKYGAILYSNMSAFNEDNDVIETIEDRQIKASLDSEVSGVKPEINQKFINNYDTPINKVVMVGKVTDSENLETTLTSDISTNRKNAKIYYSDKEDITEQDSGWTENIENLTQVKSYKLELEELQPKEEIEVTYNLNLSNELKTKSQANRITEVTYEYNGQEFKSTQAIALVGKEVTGRINLAENVIAEYTAKSANKVIAEGEEIPEGQPIQYEVTITNKTGEALENLQLTAEHTNAVYFVEKEQKIEIGEEWEHEEGKTMLFTQRDEEAQNITKTLGTLENNQKISYEYTIEPKRLNGNETSGNIKVKADNLEENEIPIITNKIKDATLSGDIENSLDEKEKACEGYSIPFRLAIRNLTDEKQKDVIVNVYGDQKFELVMDDELLKNDQGIERIAKEDGDITLKIPELNEKEEKEIQLLLKVNGVDKNTKIDQVPIYFTVTSQDMTYFSNTLTRSIYREKATIEGKQESNKEGKELRNGDKIIYTSTITNTDGILAAEGLTVGQGVTSVNGKITKSYIEKENGEKIDATISSSDYAQASYNLQPGETIKYISEVEAWENPKTNLANQEKLQSNVTVSWNVGGSMLLNTITNEYTKKPEGFGEKETSKEIEIQSGDPEEEQGTGGTGQGEGGQGEGGQGESRTSSISGTAWVDHNKDGKKDGTEQGLENVEVGLISSETEEVLKTTETNKNGTYQFTDLADRKI